MNSQKQSGLAAPAKASKSAAEAGAKSQHSTAASLNPPSLKSGKVSQRKVIQANCDTKSIGGEGMDQAFSGANSKESDSSPLSLKR